MKWQYFASRDRQGRTQGAWAYKRLRFTVTGDRNTLSVWKTNHAVGQGIWPYVKDDVILQSLIKTIFEIEIIERL